MTLVSLVLAAAAALSLCASPPAAAQFMGLRNLPIERMTKEDIALMTRTYTEALDQNPDGHTSTWVNPKTGSSGTATPLSTGTEKGMRCRRLEITNAAGGVSNRSEFRFCKTKDGWRAAS
jgi:surface antigen